MKSQKFACFIFKLFDLSDKFNSHQYSGHMVDCGGNYGQRVYMQRYHTCKGIRLQDTKWWE